MHHEHDLPPDHVTPLLLFISMARRQPDCIAMPDSLKHAEDFITASKRRPAGIGKNSAETGHVGRGLIGVPLSTACALKALLRADMVFKDQRPSYGGTRKKKLENMIYSIMIVPANADSNRTDRLSDFHSRPVWVALRLSYHTLVPSLMSIFEIPDATCSGSGVFHFALTLFFSTLQFEMSFTELESNIYNTIYLTPYTSARCKHSLLS